MTKTKAVSIARKTVTMVSSWDDTRGAWVQETKPAGRQSVYWLRDRRAHVALVAMGYSAEDVDRYIEDYGPGSLVELVNGYIDEQQTVQIRHIEHVIFAGRKAVTFDVWIKQGNAWLFQGRKHAPEGTAKKRYVDYI